MRLAVRLAACTRQDEECHMWLQSSASVLHAIDIHLNKMKIVLNRVDTLVSFWEASQESLLGPQNGSCPQGKAQGQNQAESLALKTVRSWRPKKKLKLKPLIAVATSQQNQIQRQGTQRWSKVANAFGHLANSTTTSAARLKRDVKTLRCLASLWAWQSLFLVPKNWWSWLDPKKCLVNVTIPINGLITISQCGNNKATGWLAALVRVTNLKLSFSRRRDKMLVLCAACQQQPCWPWHASIVSVYHWWLWELSLRVDDFVAQKKDSARPVFHLGLSLKKGYPKGLGPKDYKLYISLFPWKLQFGGNPFSDAHYRPHYIYLLP